MAFVNKVCDKKASLLSLEEAVRQAMEALRIPEAERVKYRERLEREREDE